MKKTVLFLVALFLAGTMVGQQLSFRFANPRIIRTSGYQTLQFDIQIKCDVAGTYLWASQMKLNFNNTLFNNNSTTWTVLKIGAFNDLNSAGGFKYTVTKTITGTSPNKLFNLALTGDVQVAPNGPNADDFTEVPTDYVSLVTIKARFLVTTGEDLAGIDFFEAGMNGYQQYISAPSIYTLYTNPNIFDPKDFLTDYTGRFYSTLYGWSSLGGTTNDVQVNSWSTAYSTTVWEDSASIDQTNLTTALANNLKLKNGAKLVIPENKWLTVSGSLENQGTAGNLVVESGGSLIHNTVDVPGTIERYVTGSTDLNAMLYHFVSVPLTQTTYPTENIFYGSYLFELIEESGTWNSLGSAITTDTLDVAKGYMMYYPGGPGTTNVFEGYLNSGDFTAVTTHTGLGYNLVPNPYASAIDWSTGSWVKTGLDDAIYIWPAGASASSSNYASYVGGVGNNDGTPYIPVGQSFMVHANAPSPLLSMDNSVRVHNAQAFWKDGEIIPNLLRISSVANDAKDETVIRFTEPATNDFDPEWDAYKMEGGNEAPQLSSEIANGTRLSINSLETIALGAIIPLHFTMNSMADVTFTANGSESFEDNVTIYLEDRLLNNFVNLRLNPEYTFSYSTENDPERFRLHFGFTTDNPNPTSILLGNAYYSNGSLFVKVPAMEGERAEIQLFDIQGKQILSHQAVMNDWVKIPVSVISGVYLVRTISGKKYFTSKIVKY